MTSKWLCIGLLICFGSFSWAAEEDVLDWTDDDFKDELPRHKNSLVMFYAPWCGHCKKLKPEFAKAAELLRGHDPPITLAKVDCTEAGKSTCNDYSVQGYPTLKIFANEEPPKEYNGPRDAEGIAKYIKSQVGPASKEIFSSEDFNSLFNDPNVVNIVGFFEDQSFPLFKTFQSVANQLREKATFAHTFSKEVSESENYKNTIVLYRPKSLHNKFEDNKVTCDGNGVEEIKKCIKHNFHGIVGVRTPDNIDDFRKPLVVAFYDVDYVKNPKITNYWRNRIIKVAKEFENEFNFAISPKDHFQQELNEFGIDYSKSDKPVVLARDEQNQKFVLEGDFSIESLTKFMNDLQAGSLEPYIKSEPIPEDNSSNVKVAVAKNFDDVVINNGKDTLIEFYAPWCGYCKKLAPVYDELGEKLANEDIEIVKCDATANDVPPPYDLRGFPTLYWVPKDSKASPIRYEGGRELDDFIKYIAKHATNPLKGWDRSGKPIKAAQDEL
ncbi:protein disulfide-isomerase A3 [Copidosoma floridanum]|uniref:protein disulfide-isomerase A3 n=1 Tax=Copidosoma floridanum TaxID=29053 RepID=UPI000C6F9A38|nr:protein disulfide-isomerase A3 [Copidosoma floridanum]